MRKHPRRLVSPRGTDALTVVDTDFPTPWKQLPEHLDALDYGPGDIEA